MKPDVTSEKRGAILVIVMVVLVAVSLLTAALLQLGSFNEMETIQQLRTTQAHWLAEAGLERSLSRVMGSKDYRDTLSASPTFIVNDETLLDGLGSYEVEITQELTANPLIDRYVITSTGTVSNNAMRASKTVRISLEAGAGGQQAIMALGNSTTSTSHIAANGTVNGTIYVTRTLDIANGNMTLTDIIDAGTITGNSGAATVGDLPDPGPPTLNQTPYTTAISQTSAYTNLPLTISSPLVLTSNLYVNGNVTINANVSGSGNIVSKGTVDVGNGVTVGTGVGIFASGNITFGNHITLSPQVVIFSQSNIDFETHGSGGADSTANGVILLAAGNITTKNIDFDGIIFALGNVNVTSGSDVTGTIIAYEGFNLASGVTVTYDPNVFAIFIPNPINYGDSLAIQTGTLQWEESPFN